MTTEKGLTFYLKFPQIIVDLHLVSSILILSRREGVGVEIHL